MAGKEPKLPREQKAAETGREADMRPRSRAEDAGYRGSAKLRDRVALISGGDSGIGRGIRVNGVAPGPIWTPLIPANFPPDYVESFGRKTPMGRPGQPEEVAPCYVFLASDDSSFMSGQILHPNGGEVVGA